MPVGSFVEFSQQRITRVVRWVAMGWIAAVVCSLLWMIGSELGRIEDLARSAARSSYEKDLLYRRWASLHGGVYVPPTEKTPPNPYLKHIPERDVVTTGGKALTLVNPAHMPRQMHELGLSESLGRGHFTSLNPLRPENAPDPWEREALQAFAQGAKEVSAVATIDGADHMRLMRPMVTEASCLKCHEHQGYRVGDVRGGLSVSVPLAPYANDLRGHLLGGVAVHLIFGGLGLAGLYAGRRRMAESWQERQKVEEDRRNAEQRWQAALESVGDGLWDWNVETDEVFFSDSLKTILGGKAADFRPHVDEWKSRVHPDDLPTVLGTLQRHLAGETPVYESQHRLRCQDGSYKWILDRGRVIGRGPDGRARRFIGTHTDITAQRLLEAQLRESWEQYHALFERNPIPFWVYDEQSLELLAVNEAAVRHYGYSRSEFLAMTLRDLHPPEEWTRWERAAAESGAEASPGGAWRHRRRSGEEILVEVACSRVNWRGRKARCAQNLDVTARRRTEAGLAESESRYRSLVEASPYCIQEFDLDGRMTSINAAGLKMLGVTEVAKVRGRAYLGFVDAADRERVAQLMAQAGRGQVAEFEYTAVSGSVFFSTL